MGCDIWPHLEKFVDGKWIECDDLQFLDYNRFECTPFNGRNYTVFGFLANVRRGDVDYPILSDNRGVPDDISETLRATYVNDYMDWSGCYHSATYVTLEELLSVDYDKEYPYYFYSGAPAPLKKILGKQFMEDLNIMKNSGLTLRVIMWFDN